MRGFIGSAQLDRLLLNFGLSFVLSQLQQRASMDAKMAGDAPAVAAAAIHDTATTTNDASERAGVAPQSARCDDAAADSDTAEQERVVVTVRTTTTANVTPLSTRSNGSTTTAPTAANATTPNQPRHGDHASLLDDLLQIKTLYASNHLSDVLFVFASEKRTTSADPTALLDAADSTANSTSRDEESDAPEHHLLPAHRLVLALRSGTFRSALLRTKSSQVPGQVRFPLKIHVQDTPYRAFAALVRFLYTNEAPTAALSSSNQSSAAVRERDAFWNELLRASYVYLVPSLLEICVSEIVQMLGIARASPDSSDRSSKDANDPERLRKIFDVLVFTDSVLAAKHPTAAAAAAAAASKRRASKKAAESPRHSSRADHDRTPSSDQPPASSSTTTTDQVDDGDDSVEDLGLVRCSSAIRELQYLCVSTLTVIPDKSFEVLVHTDVGRRCTTERLCDVLKQRSDTPLVVAIRYQLGRVVNELLKRGEPLDEFFDDESDLPLVAALKTGNDAIIRRLLVDADAPYFLLTDKIPLFLLASASGSVAHCRILIEQSGAQVNMVSELEDGDKDIVAEFGRGQTPLHIASRKGHAAVVELLLQHSAVANLQDHEGNTALHCALTMETAEILLRSAFKTNPNIPNRRGQTPLHVAAANGNVGIVDLLIRSGCQQDIVDDQGQTAFHVAAANGHTSVALILLRENESFERTQLHRRTSEKLTSLSSSSGLASAANDSASGDQQSGSTDDTDSDAPPQFVVNQEDLKGNTALHLAAMSPSERCQKMIQLLLENGADPNHTNWFGYTPLHLFCSHQSGPDSVIDVFVRRHSL